MKSSWQLLERSLAYVPAKRRNWAFNPATDAANKRQNRRERKREPVLSKQDLASMKAAADELLDMLDE